MKEIQCNKDCKKCSQLNTRVDGKDYPYGYECLKYEESVFENSFADTKTFIVND